MERTTSLDFPITRANVNLNYTDAHNNNYFEKYELIDKKSHKRYE